MKKVVTMHPAKCWDSRQSQTIVMIGDRAYDSDRLDRDLAERYGIEMIAPLPECAENPPKTAAFFVATADLGELNDFSLRSIIFRDS